MRVGINLVPVLPGAGGSWHYVQNLLAALAEHDRETEFVPFVTDLSARLVPRATNFSPIEVGLDASRRVGRIAWESTALPVLERRAGLHCMHHVFGTLPFFGAAPTIVSVFDLMVFTRPQDFSAAKRIYLQRMRRRAARHASVLAPMSNATADALHERLDVDRDRIVVVPTAIGSRFSRRASAEVADVRSRFGLPSEFWLFIAAPYVHKNLPGLLDAYAGFRASFTDAWPLVLRSVPGDALTSQIHRLGLESHVRFIPWVDDADMPALFSAASALVFPSLHEGGGIPVMEAMACGTPIVASDLPTTREFAGQAALTFDPCVREDIIRAMQECQASPERRALRVEEGLRNAARLSTRAVAGACQSAYRLATVSMGASA